MFFKIHKIKIFLKLILGFFIKFMFKSYQKMSIRLRNLVYVKAKFKKINLNLIKVYLLKKQTKNTCNMPYIIRLESYQRQNLPIDLTVELKLTKNF